MGHSKKIKKVRKDAMLSQRQLASLLGVSGNYISMLENGLRTPSRLFLLALAYKASSTPQSTEKFLIDG